MPHRARDTISMCREPVAQFGRADERDHVSLALPLRDLGERRRELLVALPALGRAVFLMQGSGRERERYGVTRDLGFALYAVTPQVDARSPAADDFEYRDSFRTGKRPNVEEHFLVV